MTDLDQVFDEATSARITDEDIAAQGLLVGVDTAGRLKELFSTATPEAIRNFARGYGDDNPLFDCEGHGRSTRWGEQIAPPIMAGVINAPLKGDPIDPELKAKTKGVFNGIHVFVSGGRWEFFRPVRPGDRIYNYEGIESLEVKESEFANRSVIRTRRYVKFNQRAEVVAIHRVIVILAERKTARDKGKYSAIEPASYTESDIAELDAVYEAEVCTGPNTRYFEDVTVGDRLGPMAKGPLTETEIICFHAGGYGFTPYAPSASRIGYQNRQRIPGFYVNNAQGVPDVAQRVHWDSKWAQAVGNPMAYDYGFMRECWVHHLLTDWVGDDGWVLSQHDRVQKFNYIGDIHYLTGTVTDKRTSGDQHLVDVEIEATNQRGDITVTGTAVLLLPSRETGSIVLPRPPADLERKSADMLKRHHELTLQP